MFRSLSIETQTEEEEKKDNNFDYVAVVGVHVLVIPNIISQTVYRRHIGIRYRQSNELLLPAPMHRIQ